MKPLETIPGAMTSIDQMVFYPPGLIPQSTRAITHTRFWAATIFMDHYSGYFYAHLMRGTSDEETLRTKEAYERLAATHMDRN